MAEKTTIEPDPSRRIFKNIEAIAGDLEAALKDVETIRTTLHEPWGTDETGQKFAQSREPNAEATLGYVHKAVKYLHEMSAEGGKAIDEFQNLDRENGQGLAPEPRQVSERELKPRQVLERETKPRQVSERELEPLQVLEHETKPRQVSERELEPLQVLEHEPEPRQLLG